MHLKNKDKQAKDDKEAFVVAFLNTKNRIIDHEVVSVGTINSSLVHPREGLLDELFEMQIHLEQDETELLGLTKLVMDKISAMKDEEFEDIIVDLVADLE